MKHSKTLTTALCSALAAFCAASAAATETKGPVTDDIGVLVIPKGAPIQIGAYWVMSGADSALGIDEKRRARQHHRRDVRLVRRERMDDGVRRVRT